MSNESPNGLQLRATPNRSGMAKWPIYAVLGALLVMLAALVYSVNFAHNNDNTDDQNAVTLKEEEKPVWLVEGSGLALDPKKDQQSGVIAPPEKPREPIVIIQKNTEKEEEIDREAENIRRMKAQAFLSALSSGLSVRREGKPEQQSSQSPNSKGASEQQRDHVTSTVASASGGDIYDPAADRDKEAFFKRAHADTSWELLEKRTAGKEFELKTGTVLPGVMITGINSDLPGNMIAQVSQNVYDSATGRALLVPQGTKIYGVYDARVVYGQERVLIAWNRLIFPDGSSINLGAMPGSDMAGLAGFHDEVDNHYLKVFGSAVMMSLVTGGMAYALDSTNTSGGQSENGTSMQDEMTSALAAQLGQTASTLLQKNLTIKPTLEIRPGYQFNIVVTKDVAFAQAYQPWRR